MNMGNAPQKTFLEAALDRDLGALAALNLPPEQINTIIQTGVTRDTPLMHCIRRRFPAGLKYLLEHGADPNFPGPGGMLPVVDAARIGDVDCLELLISHGGNINSAFNGESALASACFFARPDCVRVLLAAGVDPINQGDVDIITHAGQYNREPDPGAIEEVQQVIAQARAAAAPH